MCIQWKLSGRGGITGTSIALDAATRGVKTLLFERQYFAAGSWCRSTKLVQGGLS
ncbi:FAD-dependent oxidoreductase [Psychrobacter frigidicola]|uniref:FAD-dependent oxidoreductase n=1 Tax=Psychrobacter TaxID=497 RepID=UPI0039B757E4